MIHSLHKQHALLKPRPPAWKDQGHHSRAAPHGFHTSQFSPHQSQIGLLQLKCRNLCLDIGQHAIELLDRDRQTDRPPVSRLSSFLRIPRTRQRLEWDRYIIFKSSIFGSSSTPDVCLAIFMCIDRRAARSSEQCMSLRVNVVTHIRFPDHPARTFPRFYRGAEAVRTNDSILDTATIDATGGRR